MPFVNHAIIHPPVDRDRPPNEVSDVCCHVEKRNRRRHHRVGRQGRRDRFGADQLHLRRASRPDPGAGQEFRRDLHDPDQRAGRETDLPHVLRNDIDRDGLAVRLSVVEPARRKRRGVHHGQGAGALGKRVLLRRRREGEQLLSAHRLPAARAAAWLHAAGREARFHRRPAAQGGGSHRQQGFPRRAGQCRRGAGLSQSVLGPVGSDGAQPEAVDRRISVAGYRSRPAPTRSSRRWPTPRSSTSSSRPWPPA